MTEDILRINHVSKKYRLGMIGGTTLRDELQRKRARRKGLEDPTSVVGSKSTGKIGEEFFALDEQTFIQVPDCSLDNKESGAAG